MRIAHVSESIDPRSGGPSTAQQELLAALAGAPEVELSAYAPAVASGDGLDAALRGRFHWTGRVGRLRAGDLAARVVADLGRYDLVHLHGLWNPDIVRVASEARRAGVATVWQPHGMLVEQAYRTKWLKKKLFMAMGLRRELLSAGALVCCTEGERITNVRSGQWAQGHSVVIPLPVDCPISHGDLASRRISARASLGVDPDIPVIVFLGRLHPVKRLELTLGALAVARESVPALRMLILGRGEADYERSLRDLSESLGVADALTFGGWIERDKRWDALAAGDALTINSMFENFGYVIPEALMVGTSVVATNNLAMAADLQASGIGPVASPDPRGLGEAYRRALSQTPEQRERARCWADERFAPARVASRLVALYRSLLAGGESLA